MFQFEVLTSCGTTIRSKALEVNEENVEIIANALEQLASMDLASVIHFDDENGGHKFVPVNAMIDLTILDNATLAEELVKFAANEESNDTGVESGSL